MSKSTDTTKPNNAHSAEDGGYLFTAWNIHVVAKSLKEAKTTIKEAYGVDVDSDVPPPKVDQSEE